MCTLWHLRIADGISAPGSVYTLLIYRGLVIVSPLREIKQSEAPMSMLLGCLKLIETESDFLLLECTTIFTAPGEDANFRSVTDFSQNVVTTSVVWW